MSFIVARRPSSLPLARARLSNAPERIDPRSVKIVSPTTLRFLPRQRQGRIMGGWRNRACIIRLGGVVTWQLASSFREMMKKAKAESASGIQVDLAECEVMDSTMLGVLLQYAGDITLHQAGRRVMEQLREMGVDGQFEFSHEPCSPFEAPIAIEPTESKEACSELILSAHEALMEASASNRLRFGDVVAALRPSEDTDR
jgi:anti-anti-sigma regulatory factor